MEYTKLNAFPHAKPMRSNFSKTAAIFFSPETLLPFVIGSIFLSVLGNSVSQIIENAFGTSYQAAIGVGLGSLLIFLLAVYLFARGLQQLEPRALVGARTPAQRRGLILLVSREQPCRIAIRHHLDTLEHCWLLHSNWDQSEAAVEQLVQEFLGRPGLQIKPIPVPNIYDPLECYAIVRKIYRNLPPGWDVNDVIADYTGMTVNQSVGVVLATYNLKAPLQYTPEDSKKPGGSMQPIEIVLR